MKENMRLSIIILLLRIFKRFWYEISEHMNLYTNKLEKNHSLFAILQY